MDIRPKACKTALALLLLVPASVAAADCVTNRYGDTVCPPADSQCTTNRYGDWVCSGPGGGILVNRIGVPVCGAGQCVIDNNGEVMCSTEARGAAGIDRYGKAVCTSGCAAAKEERCTPLTR